MTHMTSNIARTTAGAPLNREEATRVVNTVSHKIIDVLCHQPANTSTNLDTIATMFCQKAVAYILADLYRCTNMTYTDIMNGTMDDFRVYIGHVNNYVNRLLNWRYGSVSIYRDVYKGGYDSIKASGIVGRFTRKPDECFNDAMLKPFFVAGCMSEIRSLVKDYEARTSKTDTVACNKNQPTLSTLPPESTTKTAPAITQPQMPSCANYCPVTTHATKMPANAVSAPTM